MKEARVSEMKPRDKAMETRAVGGKYMYSAEKENRGAINKNWTDKVQANDDTASWSGETEYAADRVERDRSERIITRG